MKLTKPNLLFLALLFSLQLSAQSSACLGSDTVRIVVIGSSTAAGTGASTTDSAWVNRYRAFAKSINPANEVINLARGGYNTWRLMPDYFVQPSGRPAPDTLRNISHAIRQNPDGIIINLPSNDAAIGTGINEQMSNFIHMDSLAQVHGIPVWVCTTQPRNFAASYIQVQLGVRDSVLSYFGSRALDFWTGLANSQNTVDSLYNSGDGVHVNDAGHRLLWQRVVQKGIIDSLAQGVSGLDFNLQNIQWIPSNPCGNKQSEIRVYFANQGMDSLNQSAELQLIRYDHNSGISDTLRKFINQVPACSYGQSSFWLNTSPAQHWSLYARIVSSQDLFGSNNQSDSITVQSIAAPTLQSTDALSCDNQGMWLQASSSDDNIGWFADPNLSTPIQTGDSLYWSGQQTDTFYLQAFRGPFYYVDEVQAAPGSNITWNGAMFNLIAGNDTVYIDSIRYTSGTTADVQVNLRTKLGSYIGFENNAAAWSPVVYDSVYNALDGQDYFVSFGAISIAPGDTLGCYMYMQNSSHRLSYQSGGSMFTYQGAGLGLHAGSGIAYTFGTIYNPRHIRAKVYYHYGFKPDGYCQSSIDTLIAASSSAVLSLGPDTVTTYSQFDYSLKLPAGFSNAIWQDGSQLDSIVIPAFSYIDTLVWFSVQAEDSLGCLRSDSIAVYFQNTISLKETDASFEYYPNPSKGELNLRFPSAERRTLRLYNSQGKLCHQSEIRAKELQKKLKLEPGYYWLQMEEAGKTSSRAWIIY